MSNSTKPISCPFPKCSKRCKKINHLRHHIREKHDFVETDFLIRINKHEYEIDATKMAMAQLDKRRDEKQKDMIQLERNKFDKFRQLCLNRPIEECKQYHNKNGTFTQYICKYNVFEEVCCLGYIDKARWLYQLYYRELSAEYTFQYVCYSGQLEVAKWLLWIVDDCTYIDFDSILLELCSTNGDFDMIKWVSSLVETNSADAEYTHKAVFDRDLHTDLNVSKYIYDRFQEIGMFSLTLDVKLRHIPNMDLLDWILFKCGSAAYSTADVMLCLNGFINSPMFQTDFTLFVILHIVKLNKIKISDLAIQYDQTHNTFDNIELACIILNSEVDQFNIADTPLMDTYCKIKELYLHMHKKHGLIPVVFDIVKKYI